MSNRPGLQIESSPAEQFFGLSARPFSLTPDLRFAFHSRSHSRALEQVTESLRRREGIIVVTGAIGTGKTMLCRSMLETFETRTFLSVILDPQLEADDMLRQVLTDFGIIERTDRPMVGQSPEATRHQLVSTLQQFLASLIPLRAHAVIMIDEAQHLGPDVLEEIRLLSNFETDEAKLLQIVLVGQPDLENILRRPDMRQLNQRVARHCQLYPLSETEVAEYVERRIAVAASPAALAGQTEPGTIDRPPVVRFSPAALKTVAALSGGIPRVVNTLCDRALDAAFERQTTTVDPDAVISAAERLHLDVPLPEPVVVPTRSRTVAIAAGALLVVAAVAGGWWWTHRSPDAGAIDRPPVEMPSTPASTSRELVSQPEPATAPPAAPPAVQAPPPPAPNSAAAPGPGAAAAAAAPTAPAPAPASVSGSAPAGSFTIAVAAFRTEQRAREVAASISTLPVPARVQPDSTGTWYRVLAGPFTSRDAADSAQGVLTKNGYADTRMSRNTSDAR